MDINTGSQNNNFHTDEEQQIYSEFNMQSILWFTLASEEYAIKVEDVQTVLDDFVLTPVPNTDSFILGVINLRGTIIPVVDLKRMFQMPASEKKEEMVVVLEIGDLNNLKVGILVDRVNEVLDIDFSALQDPPPSLSSLGSEYVTGMHKMASNVLIIVDIVKIIQIAKQIIDSKSKKDE